MKIGTFLLHVEKLRELCGTDSWADTLKHPSLEGIACVDGDTAVYDRLDVKEFKRCLDDRGIQTSSVYHVANCDEILGTGRAALADDLKYQLDRCAFMETKMLMSVPGNSDGMAFADCRRRMLEYFNLAAELAKPYGILAVAENYSRPWRTFATVQDVAWYLEQLPQLGFVLDTGNFWFTGSDALEACRRFVDRIVHVHIKDMKNVAVDPPRSYDGRGFDSVAIGSGDTPIRPILECLRSHGYAGTLSIEISSPVGLEEKLARSVRYLKNWTE